MRTALLLLILFLAPRALLANSELQPWLAEGTQMVVVSTADWQASTGKLHAFERRHGQWKPVSMNFPVSIGKNGTGWGIGLHPGQSRGPVKTEGDGKAPAGIFAIGMAFGQLSDLPTALDYQAMTVDDWCIDVNASPLYNRIVSSRVVGKDAIEGSSEPMRRDLHSGDHLYRKGFVIAHNPENTPAGGSCIFAHLWRRPDAATAGCTAMDEADMDALLHWLDRRHNPVFVLLPTNEYERLRSPWHLPSLTSKN